MPTLSSDELTDIRLITGADDTTVLSNAQLQTLYDAAFSDAPDSTLILPFAYVYVLRRLLGYQRTRVDRNTDHGDRQTREQIFENTQALLAYWEGVAGLSGKGILATGIISLGLDEDDPGTG